MKLLLLTLFSTFLIGVTSVRSEQGLNYKYYEGTWSLLPNFNSLTPVKSGVISTPNLDPRLREKQYAFLYQGYITIPAAGNYTFETLSDDGSKLYIGTYDFNAIALVNNDGLHINQIRSGTIALNAGVYPITLAFFQNDGNQSWEYYWSSNTGISHQKIPSGVFSTGSSASESSNPSGSAGLKYSYYEGAWSNMPDFSSLTPVKTGTTANVDLGPRNRERQYAFVWQGYINIPLTGTYAFQTISDDGSKLFVGPGSTALVNNDGLHSPQEKNASIALNAGLNPITITYFQNEGDQQLEVYWSSTTAGITRQKIPDNLLSTGSVTSSPPPATPESQGALNYNYYEGKWSNLPDFNSLTPVKSGTTTNIDLSPRNRDKQFAFIWQGNINIPASGNYTFETSSDDGSKLYIGTTELVNNDGLHGYNTRTGTIALNAGLYPITAMYFQNEGDQYMELYWSSNTGISRQRVPSGVLSATSSVAPPSTPAPPPVESIVPPVVYDPPATPGSGGLTGVNNYYFSSSKGDDGRSAAQARNPSTPWRTINKLNSVMPGLQAGDAVLLNRGDVFEGSINPASGIVISAYGNGNKPLVTGFATLSNWSSIGNGVWQASCPSGDRINMVAMNGNAQAMGRYPNASQPDRGYNRFEAHSGTSQITDYQLSGSINYTGAEVVIRKNNWVLDRCLITNHSGNNINYNSPTAHVPIDNYGYFIQNSPYTLDQLGEWYFDPAQRVLKMYFGSSNPNSYDVKASTVNALVAISGKSNITIDNIAFNGGDDYGIKVEYSQNIRVQNCAIDLSGMQAVSALQVNNFAFEANSITNTNNDALDCNGNSNSSFRYNTVKNTGLLIGMGQSGNQQYNGILVEGPGNTIEYNSVINTGYSGITFAGESCLIKNNYVDNFCLTVEDGGGIYTWGDLTKYNRRIIGNIIVNGIGTSEGTTYEFSTGATGIFHDDESANVEMLDNTIANCSRAGIFFHNSHDMTMKNNTVFNNRTQITMIHDPISINHPIRNLTLDNNILFSRISSQFIMEVGSIKNDLANFGNFNYNYYSRPVDDNGVIYTYFKDGGSGNYKYAFYDVNGWRTAYSAYDQQSKASPVKIPSYSITGYNGGNRYPNSGFNSNTSGVYCLSSPGKCTVSWNNGGKLDGGALQISYDANGNNLNDVGNYIDIGPVQAGRNYQIKFSLIGSKPGKTIKAFLMDGASYGHISETRYFEMGTSRTENDFMFTAPVSTSTTLLSFESVGPDSPYWMDNLQVFDVNINIANPDDYIRFIFNPTTDAKSYSLNGNFVDARNNAFSGNITLAPFTSAVLIKQSGGLLTANSAQRQMSVMSSEIVQELEDTKSLSVKVTPNPTRNNLQILLNAPQGTQKTNLSIYNISGILMKAIPITSTTQNLNVDVSSWSTGAYIINYVCDGRVIYKKFVKQ